jgi:hypothetical protein
MKKILIIGTGFLLLTVATLYVGHRIFVFAYSGTIIEGLTHDLADFYGEHNRLPASWTEFASWSRDRNSLNHWDASQLQSLFALQWGASVSPDHPPSEKLFTVLDREDFAGIESTVNDRLYFRCLYSVGLYQKQLPHP